MLTRQELLDQTEKIDTLVLLQAVRCRLDREYNVYESTDDSTAKRHVSALPFVNAAIDSYIGYSRRKHTLVSVGPDITETRE
jgi:hypothetical protein